MVSRERVWAAVFGCVAWLVPFFVAVASPPEQDWAAKALGTRALPGRGAVTSDDLLRLRDLDGFSLSPDGGRLAFSIRQAVPEQNAYVVRWFIMRADGLDSPKALDIDGGQPITAYAYGLPHAAVIPEVAKWSPDGTRIAFRRRVGHRIELWQADATSLHSTQVSDGTAQVTDVMWTTTGLLMFRTGLNYETFRQALNIEARHGWSLNSRMLLSAARAPEPTEPDCRLGDRNAACESATFVVQPDGKIRSASPEDSATSPTPSGSAPQFAVAAIPPVAMTSMRTSPRPSDHASAWLENIDPAKYKGFRPVMRVATDAGGGRRCNSPACVGAYIRGLGWARGGSSVWILKGEGVPGRQDGAPRSDSAFYEWWPLSQRVRKVLRTADLIEGCQVDGTRAYCMRETPVLPRHIVEIDLEAGTMKVLADPNPEFARKAFPKIERLPLEDFAGNPGTAHLVYPYGYEAGRAYPLVIVQYRSRGFLRGGVGDEYPIFPLALEGFFVLSTDKPEDWYNTEVLDQAEYERVSTEDLRDRRRNFSAIERAVDSLISRGLVDRGRVAITGFSAGAEIVHYALQHSMRFAAAIASNGAHDQTFLALVPEGDARTRLMSMFDTRELLPPPDSAIAKLSWSRMPERLRTPLLINVGQYEALMGFEGLQALGHAGRPLEVRIFPDEMHVKYHPQSYAGIYENNMMWLRFWLKGEEDPRPEFADQYVRWRKMREQRDSEVETPR